MVLLIFPCCASCLDWEIVDPDPTPELEWIDIEPGSFLMGSPEEELGRNVNEIPHRVTLTRSYQILSTEVTQRDFQILMGYNPTGFPSCGQECPIDAVNWHESVAFCNELSNREGLERCYRCEGRGTRVECRLDPAYSTPYDCPGVRLPTEAEWEYAAQAGDEQATYNGNLSITDCSLDPVLEPIAWYCFNSGGKPNPVGRLAPNAWGLFDMLGNVFEWCNDWYSVDNDDAIDPTGPEEGSMRVRRGGSWFGEARLARAASRYGEHPEEFFGSLGFRPVKSDLSP